MSTAAAGGQSARQSGYLIPQPAGAREVSRSDANERLRALEHEIQRLIDADRRKDHFLAVLAHELRNLLAPLGYAVDLMHVSGESSGVARECCDAINRQVVQMVRLVDDLLDVSRIAQGKLQLRRELVDLAAVIQNAVEISRPAIDAGRQTLHLGIPDDAIHAYADGARLSQVVANLLINSAKYTPPAGNIWLAVQRSGLDAEIRIRDDGEGIAPHELSRIFQMFSQIGPTDDRSRGGLGIGLALSKSIVELHSGSITAHSDGPGRGSEFAIRLPL